MHIHVIVRSARHANRVQLFRSFDWDVIPLVGQRCILHKATETHHAVIEHLTRESHVTHNFSNGCVELLFTGIDEKVMKLLKDDGWIELVDD
jgi:hypothetical protein